MKVYIATAFVNRARARAVRDRLLKAAADLGCKLTVTARWMDQQEQPTDPIEDILGQSEWASRCEQDLYASDALIVLTENVGHGTGGMHVETGMALAKDKRVFMVGPEINVFHYHPRVQKFPSEDQCLAAVLRMAGAQSKRAA